MADSPVKTGDSEAAIADASGIRLSKDQRKELLAEIERQLSRADSPRRILQRAEQALTDGNVDQARRLLQNLESTAPEVVGLDILRARLEETEKRGKHKANLRQAEEMLRRFIQQRKKPLAEMALETLVELAPNHPRLGEYRTWVADLDRELELQQRIDGELAAGRAALRADDTVRARRHLQALEKLDPTAIAVEILAAEVAAAEQGMVQSAGIERLKEKAEELLRDGRFEDAERDIEELARMDVPKITIDVLRRQLGEALGQARDNAEAEALVAAFHNLLEKREWQAARDVAHRFGERFPDRPDAARFFNLVTEKESAERRQQSLAQGITTLEKLLADGKKAEAEVALKLLRQLKLDEARLAAYEQRVARL